MNRINTGIEGLDQMLMGGIPEDFMVAVIGAYGTGKTTFNLQFILAGLQKEQRCIYISLEEEEPEIIETAKCYGFDLMPHINSNNLLLIKLDAIDLKKSMEKLQTDLFQKIKSFNANRLVFDPITLLEMSYENDDERRKNIFHLCRNIKKLRITALLTTEPDSTQNNASKFGLIEYAVDGVIVLNRRFDTSIDKFVTSIQVIKMRRSNHIKMPKPYEITDEGIVVHVKSKVY